MEGAALFSKNFDKLPVVLRGDFNINFASPETKPLIEFWNSMIIIRYYLTEISKTKFLKNNPAIPTTKSDSKYIVATIDVVFSRYLDDLQFMYHNSVIIQLIVAFSDYE